MTFIMNQMNEINKLCHISSSLEFVQNKFISRQVLPQKNSGSGESPIFGYQRYLDFGIVGKEF